MWIFKVTGQNCGIGIHVFNELKDLGKFIKMYTKDLPKQEKLEQVFRFIDKAAGALVSTATFLPEKSPVKTNCWKSPVKQI